jgi:hypothetical protein
MRLGPATTCSANRIPRVDRERSSQASKIRRFAEDKEPLSVIKGACGKLQYRAQSNADGLAEQYSCLVFP